MFSLGRVCSVMAMGVALWSIGGSIAIAQVPPVDDDYTSCETAAGNQLNTSNVISSELGETLIIDSDVYANAAETRFCSQLRDGKRVVVPAVTRLPGVEDALYSAPHRIRTSGVSCDDPAHQLLDPLQRRVERGPVEYKLLPWDDGSEIHLCAHIQVGDDQDVSVAVRLSP